MLKVDFRAAPLFASLSDSQLDQLQRLAHRRSFDAGETVFREGDTGIGVFVVTSGAFELRHDSNREDGPQEAVLGPGEVFGLTSVLDDEPRRVSAYALTHGTCAVMTRMTFRRALMENSGLAIEVIRSMAKSLREVSALVEPGLPSGSTPAAWPSPLESSADPQAGPDSRLTTRMLAPAHGGATVQSR